MGVLETNQVQPGTADCDEEDVGCEAGCQRGTGKEPPGGHGKGRCQGIKLQP